MKDLSELSLRQKVGQLIFFGFHGTQVNDHVVSAIQDDHMGNVILFTRNFQSARQLYNLVKELHALAMRYNGVPLLISVDQEGGSITRFTSDLTWFPGSMAIAALDDPALAERVGEGIGRELRAMGINMNLGPSVDICNNEDNPNIGSRSYSNDPAVIASYAGGYVRGLQRHAIATIKHFPSIGSSNVDLHLSLGESHAPLEALKALEMRAVSLTLPAGPHTVMISHEIYHGVEDVPATVSRRMISGQLRQALGYEGLIISDCMEMKALDHYCGTARGCVRAVQAGTDLLLVCHTQSVQRAAAEALRKAVETGEISLERLDDAVGRILRYKRAYDFVYQENREGDFDGAIRAMDMDAHRRLAETVSTDAITALRGREVFSVEPGEKALFVYTQPVNFTIVDESLKRHNIAQMVARAFPSALSAEMSIGPDEDEIAALVQCAKGIQKVFVCTYNAHRNTAQADVVEALVRAGHTVGAIAMRNPFDAKYCQSAAGQLLLYEYTPPAVEGLCRILRGERQPKGRCPIPLG